MASLLRLFRSDILANSVLHRLFLHFPMGTTTEFSTFASCGLLPFLTSKKFFCLVCTGPCYRSGQVLHYNLICLSRVRYFFTCAHKWTIALSTVCCLYPHCQCIYLWQQPVATRLTVWLICMFMVRVDW